MCFDEKNSWSTLVIGTVLNMFAVWYLVRTSDKEAIIPLCLILGWQYALLMQIPDALAWRNPKSKFPGKLALVLNVTQPLFLLFMVTIIAAKVGSSPLTIYPALVVGLIYAGIVVVGTSNPDIIVTPKEDCHNLNYPWWNSINPGYYMIAMLVFICTIPSLGYSTLSLVLFLGSLLATRVMVKDGCESGSLWCWSIAGAGFITFLFYILKARFKLKR